MGFVEGLRSVGKVFTRVCFFLRSELIKERDQSLLDKTKLKEVIKKYEVEFTKQSGRPLSKEDREFHKEDFERYKVSLVFCVK